MKFNKKKKLRLAGGIKGIRQTGRTVLCDDDLTHLLQSCDEQLVSDDQNIADKLHIQRLCREKEEDNEFC